jgi:hypothetical protein
MKAWNCAAAAAAVPACLLAIAFAVALTLAMLGRHPLWPRETLNLSEAAGVDDEAEVVRLIEHGEDPNVSRQVRAGLLAADPLRVTPLEAAVASANPSMIATLLTNGATLDGAIWNQLRCRADHEEVAAMLDAHRPSGATVDCSAAGTIIRTPERERSHSRHTD